MVGKVSDQGKEEEKETDNCPTRVANEKLTMAKFSELTLIKPLGAGGFGLVKLVQVKGIDDRAYALKEQFFNSFFIYI